MGKNKFTLYSHKKRYKILCKCIKRNSSKTNKISKYNIAFKKKIENKFKLTCCVN